VISNAALHWVRDQRGAIASIARALKPGGRLVMEMGGRGNLRHLLEAMYQALRVLGIANPEQLSPWSFPSIGEYAPLLESQGLEVDFAVLFDRSTILEGGERGLKLWLEMFGRFAVEAIAPEQRKEFFSLADKFAAPALLHNGTWTIDYKRLRLVAVKL
jgi:SAM-dependent methyltransferase